MVGKKKFAHEPLVSVIIPAYNAERYIGYCIDSVIAQSYKNLEIIVIDDGSTDNTKGVRRNYHDNRVHYYCQKNGGPASARNHGLTKAAGEYIAFVDADDFISPEYIITLLRLNLNYTTFCSVCSYVKFQNKDRLEESINKNQKVKEQKMNRNAALKSLFYKKEITAYPVLKLFHHSVIKNVYFPEELRLGEDLQFVYEIIKTQDEISYTNAELYYYFQNQQSITHNFDIVIAKKHWEQLKRIKNEVNEEKEISDAVAYRMFVVAYDFFRKMPVDLEEDKFSAELRTFVKSNRLRILMDKQSKKTIRLLALLSCVCLKMSIFLCRVITGIMEKNHVCLKRAF